MFEKDKIITAKPQYNVIRCYIKSNCADRKN